MALYNFVKHSLNNMGSGCKILIIFTVNWFRSSCVLFLPPYSVQYAATE